MAHEAKTHTVAGTAYCTTKDHADQVFAILREQKAEFIVTATPDGSVQFEYPVQYSGAVTHYFEQLPLGKDTDERPPLEIAQNAAVRIKVMEALVKEGLAKMQGLNDSLNFGCDQPLIDEVTNVFTKMQAIIDGVKAEQA